MWKLCDIIKTLKLLWFQQIVQFILKLSFPMYSKAPSIKTDELCEQLPQKNSLFSVLSTVKHNKTKSIIAIEITFCLWSLYS